MSFIAAAVVGGVGALGSVGGAVISGNAARDAANKQSDAANQASQLQKQEYDQTRADQQPWREAGTQALSQMQDPGFQKSFTMSDFQQDPGYAFRMQEGQKALERSAAAGGGFNSGAFSKALTQYGQNFASNEYQNAYNRFNNDQTNRFNRLSSLAGAGQTANSQIGAAGQNYANNAGQNMMGAANAQGAAGIAGANAMNGAISNVGNNMTQGYWMNRTLSGMAQPLVPTTPTMSAPAATSSPYSLGVNYNF